MPSISSTCKALADYRGDVFLQNELVALYTMKNIKNNEKIWGLKFDHIVSFEAPITQIPFNLLINKESKFLYLLPKFDDTIRAMREDGEMVRIIDKWIK